MGKMAFWVSWPFLFMYLFTSKRTRILVVSEGDVLVVKGWLGDGGWGLPGGGLHYKEDPAEGAVRELEEETGVAVKPSDLHFLFAGRTTSENGMRYGLHAFSLELAKKPEISRQRLELTHLEWVPWAELEQDKKLNKNVRRIMAAFSKK